MRYDQQYCHRRHLSLVFKTLNLTYIQQGSLPVQQKSPCSSFPSDITLIFILVFSLAQSNYFFLRCFSLSVFLFLLFVVGTGGAFLALLLSSVLCHCFQVGLELEHIWPDKSRHCTCTCTWKERCPVCCVREGGCHRVCTRVIDTS